MDQNIWLGFSKEKQKFAQFIQLRSFGEIIITSISNIYNIYFLNRYSDINIEQVKKIRISKKETT